MILEDKSQILNLLGSKDRLYVQPIPTSGKYHPILNNLVAVYVKDLFDNTGYIIPISHPEGQNIDINFIRDLLLGIDTIFTLDKKEYLYYLKGKNVYDIKLYSNSKVENVSLPYHNWIENRFHNNYEINRLIPLLKHLEKEEKQFEVVSTLIENFKTNPGYDFFNNVAVPVFFLLERSGLRVTYKEFIELFKPQYPDLNMINNVVYTSYNLYNITGRPTNSFNSVNFAAIPKKPEYRKCFIPQNDIFVEFDFDGYHLRLLAEQIGYELTPEPAHTQIARILFNKQEITTEEYNKAKQLNFQAVYGTTPEEYREFKFFKGIDNYTKSIWDSYRSNGYAIAPISQKVFSTDLPDMYPKKLLNYIVQSLETSRNINALKNCLEYLQTKRTSIALYVYDSILLDFSLQDGKDTLKDLENILSENGKYPVKFKYSKNLVFD